MASFPVAGVRIFGQNRKSSDKGFECSTDMVESHRSVDIVGRAIFQVYRHTIFTVNHRRTEKFGAIESSYMVALDGIGDHTAAFCGASTIDLFHGRNEHLIKGLDFKELKSITKRVDTEIGGLSDD